MYQHCIYCSADLGVNEAVEPFPVGRALAVDARKGRLWSICSRCARWNLAPLEERWEAVEATERCFRESRDRVHSGSIGLALLHDGTRVVRVGEALPGELALWRYRRIFTHRFRLGQLWLAIPPLLSLAAIASGSSILCAGVGIPFPLLCLMVHRRMNHVVHHARDGELVTRRPVSVRCWHLQAALVGTEPDSGELRLHLRWLERDRYPMIIADPRDPGEVALLRGSALHRALARLFSTTGYGGSRRDVEGALGCLREANGASGFLAGLPGRLQSPTSESSSPTLEAALHAQPHSVRLAWEMALHDEQERRALQEGELKQLEAAWREAEEIAAIADNLLRKRSVSG